MTAVPAHQIAADLLSAANHIETFGLQKEDFGRPDGPCCIAGAISVAVTGKRWSTALKGVLFDRRSTAVDAVREVLPAFVTHWNDAPERTQAEAVAKLREAAEAVFPTDPPGRAPGGSTETGLAYMEASARFDGHGAARTEGEPS